MKKRCFVVVFSYAIRVEAEDDDEAYDKALEIWNEIEPKAYEMEYEVEEMNEYDIFEEGGDNDDK